MIAMGRYHTLRVARREAFGLYLASETGEEFLLPNRYVPEGCEIGDQLRVFLYNDSEDRPIVTTLAPKAAVGEFAVMEIVSVTRFGAFADWGLPKDLFIPHREQKPRLKVGQKAVVYVRLDEATNRVIGSTRLERFIQKTPKGFKPDQRVRLWVIEESPLGFTALIEGRYLGMIYRNEVFEPLAIGDERIGYIKAIRKDGKVDLALQPSGQEGVDQADQRVLEALKAAGGSLAVGYKIAPEEAMARFGLSRKAFKRALTSLTASGKITIEERGITLSKN